MKIQVWGGGMGYHGYGRMANEIRAALERQGVEVVDHTRDDKSPYVLFMCPAHRPEGWWEGQSINLLTMWETTGLAADHLVALPVFDKILVPSEQNREMFAKSNPNTAKFTLGCDYDTWSITPHVMSDPFTVITAGKGGRRKGIDVSIKVFRRFSNYMIAKGYPRPRLIIKSEVNLSKKYDDIVVVDEVLSEEDEYKLYASAHVYLGLSRGEGWGMIPHQTIAQGKPTILTDAHGHAEFSKYGLGIGWRPMKAETEILGRAGEWWDPSEDQAFDTLVAVFEDYDRYVNLFKKHAQGIREFTWDRTAKEIIENLAEPGEITGKWIQCPQTYLSLQVKTKVGCNIAGKSHSFVPGRRYNVTADVKRIIHDAGYLDPACIDPFEKAIYEKPRPSNIDEGFAA